MKEINWSSQKAEALKSDSTRNYVSFEDCIDQILEGYFLADIPNTALGFTHQRIFVVEIDNYAYAIPYVETESEIFLKTVYPSRRYTEFYLKRHDHD